MKTILSLSALVLVAGLAACTTTQSATDLPEGEYEKTTVKTDSAGTKYKSTTKTDVEQYDNGTKKATVKSETTKDPKGLFNKTTTSKSKTVIKE